MSPDTQGRSIDFQKAFGTVEHSSVWKALREQGIEEPYIQLLTKLYDHPRATVHAPHFGGLEPPESSGNGDPPSVSLCAGEEHREGLGKALAVLLAIPARLPVEAHDTKCGTCAGQLSAVLGVALSTLAHVKCGKLRRTGRTCEGRQEHAFWCCRRVFAMLATCGCLALRVFFSFFSGRRERTSSSARSLYACRFQSISHCQCKSYFLGASLCFAMM